MSLPIIAFTQGNKSDNTQKIRDLMFQLLDSKDVHNQLENKGWEIESIDEFTGEDNNQYFKYSFRKYNSNWEYLTVHDYMPYSYQNIVLLSTNKQLYRGLYSLIENSGYKQKDKQIHPSTTTTIFSKNTIEIKFYEELRNEYSITIYNTTEQEKRKKIFMQLQEKIRKKIAEFKQEIDARILNAEQSIKFKQYDDALFQYELISNSLDSMPENISDSIDIYHYQNILSEKNSQIEALKKEEIIQSYLKEGLNYFNTNKYDLSLQVYTNVLNLDPYNKNAKDQIKEIKAIQEILTSRKKVHSFKRISLGYYNELIDDLEDGLEEIIKESKQGNVSIDFTIHFDTLGNNLTNFSIKSSSNISKETENNIKYLLNQKQNNLANKKTMIKEYYISSKEYINIDLEWDTEKSSVKFSHKEKLPYKVSKKVNDYISSSGNYGRYKVVQKNKRINNQRNYKDILLTDYKIAGGPSNALYSLIIPGLGTKKVTYGKKGSKRMKNFFIWAAVATSVKLISNSFYTDYLNATSQEDMDQNYKNATTYNYIYVGSLSICGTIYITDFFSALSKGTKNKKKSKMLRDKLKNGPINISNDKIQIY